MKLLFCDSFRHDTTAEDQVDAITFKQPVCINEYRIVPPNIKPYPSLAFSGVTTPSNFSLEIFAKNTQSNKFERVTIEPFPYSEITNNKVSSSNQLPTDQVVIRGRYQNLSLCIFGTVVSNVNQSTNIVSENTSEPSKEQTKQEPKTSTNEITSSHATISPEELQFIDQLLPHFHPNEFIYKPIPFLQNHFYNFFNFETSRTSFDDDNSKSISLIELIEKAKKKNRAQRLDIIKQIIEINPKDIISKYGINSFRSKLGPYIDVLFQWIFDYLDGGIVEISLGIQLCLFSLRLDLSHVSEKFGTNGLDKVLEILRKEEIPGYIKTLALQLISCSLNYSNLALHFLKETEDDETMIREDERQMDSELEDEKIPRTPPPSFSSELDLNQTTPPRESSSENTNRIGEIPIEEMTEDIQRSPEIPQTPPERFHPQIIDKNGYQLILKLLLKSENSLNMKNVKLMNNILAKCHLRDILSRFESRARDLIGEEDNNLEKICRELTESSREINKLLNEHCSESDTDYINSIIHKYTQRIPNIDKSDIPFYIFMFLEQFNFLPLILLLLTEPKLRERVSFKEQAELFTALSRNLLFLASCRGGLYYIANSNRDNAQDIVNGLIKALNISNNFSIVQSASISLCLDGSSKCQNFTHLSYLLIFQLQALVEVNSFLTADKDGKLTALKNMYSLATHEIGKNSVVNALSEIETMNYLLPLLQTHDEFDIKPALPIYSVALLSMIMQHESNISLLIKEGPNIFDFLSKLENIHNMNTELKGRIQQIMDWLKPAVILRDKGIEGVQEHMRSYLRSSENSMDSGFNRQTLHSVQSCLNIMTCLCIHNPCLCASLFGQDIIADISIILQECSSAIYPNDYKILKKELNDQKGAQVHKRELHHLRILPPCLSLLEKIIQRIQSSQISEFRSPNLLQCILRMLGALGTLPSLEETNGSAHSILVNKTYKKISEILRIWRFQNVPSKIIDFVSVPRKFVIGMKILRDTMPPRLPFNEKTGEEEIRESFLLRDLWSSQLLKSSEKLSKLFSLIMYTTCKPLYYLFIEVCSQIVDLHPDLASKIVIEPLIGAIHSVASNYLSKQNELSSLLSRLLNLTLALSRTPFGKTVLNHHQLASSILFLLPKSSQKISSFLFSILYCLCSVNISIDSTTNRLLEDLPSTDELLKVLFILFLEFISKILHAASDLLQSEDLYLVSGSLFLFFSVAETSYGASKVLTILGNDTMSDIGIEHIHKLLNYVESRNPFSTLVDRALKSCKSSIESEWKEILELISQFLHRLCIQSYDLIEIRRILNWESDRKNHLIDLINELKVSSHNNTFSENLISELQSSLDRLIDCPPPESQIEYSAPRSIAERYANRPIKVPIYPTPVLNDTNLEDSDFSDLVSGNPEWFPAIAPPEESDNMTSQQEDKKDGPAPKKQKNDFQTSSLASANFVYGKSKDTFRNRKPNTSRPPSVHVDDFVRGKKPQAPKPQATSERTKDEKEDRERDYWDNYKNPANKTSRYENERDRKKPRERDAYTDFYPRYDYEYYDSYPGRDRYFERWMERPAPRIYDERWRRGYGYPDVSSPRDFDEYYQQ